jgi:hypothetical protein
MWSGGQLVVLLKKAGAWLKSTGEGGLFERPPMGEA